jgi:hypothetical protein
MRAALRAAILTGGLIGLGWQPEVSAQLPTKDTPKAAAKDTVAAERTRTKLLKVKVTVDFQKISLREVLKEFAAQADMAAERPVMWTYADGFPADTPITYACKNKPLDAALDELFKKHGLGYVVIAKEDDKHDGWVRVGKGDERGFATGPPKIETIDGDDDEKKAAGRLALAKELIEKGKPADAKAVLMLVANKFPKTKAAAEAKELLEKLNK